MFTLLLTNRWDILCTSLVSPRQRRQSKHPIFIALHGQDCSQALQRVHKLASISSFLFAWSTLMALVGQGFSQRPQYVQSFEMTIILPLTSIASLAQASLHRPQHMHFSRHSFTSCRNKRSVVVFSSLVLNSSAQKGQLMAQQPQAEHYSVFINNSVFPGFSEVWDSSRALRRFLQMSTHSPQPKHFSLL